MRKNMTAPEKKLWYDFLRELTAIRSDIKSSSVLLNKEEVATIWDNSKIPLTKGEASDSEQGDYLKIKVLRQRPIWNFIVDFYIPKYKLVIEIDWDSHYTEQALIYDRERTEYLQWLGIKVIRFTNNQVMHEFDWVCERVFNYLV